MAEVRRLVDFLPLNNRESVPVRPFFDEPDRVEPSLDTLVPANREYALRHEGTDHQGRG